MPLKLISIQETECTDFARKLYEEAFPSDERRNFEKAVELTNHYPCRFFIICEDKKPLGILVVWYFDEFNYIEHFAMLESERGKGIGKQVMFDFIKQHATKPLLLEAEPPHTSVMAERRIEFYKSLGFYLNPQTYTQPAYEKGKEEVPLCILSLKPLADNDFEKLTSILKQKVYLEHL